MPDVSGSTPTSPPMRNCPLAAQGCFGRGALLIAIVVGLVLPGVAVAVYFAIALDLVIPFRELTRLRVSDTSA
jgi:hypothetical protein